MAQSRTVVVANAPVSWLRLAMTSWGPAAANLLARLNPIPELPPVITTTFDSTLNKSFN